MSKGNEAINATALRLYQDGLSGARLCNELDSDYPGHEFAWQRKGTLIEVFKTEPMRERVFSYVER